MQTEEDVKREFITPSVEKAGWKIIKMEQSQKKAIRNACYDGYEYSAGRVLLGGDEPKRSGKKRTDYALYHKLQIPLAIIEAKAPNKGDGLSQAADYARELGTPFAYSSNGSGFKEHDLITQKISNLAHFPSPEELYERYLHESGLEGERAALEIPYFYRENFEPRYYQVRAIEMAYAAILKGERRILLVLATGTGKTFVAYQIAHRLYKAGRVKKILFLADRNVLIDQAKSEFKSFGRVATTIKNHHFDSSYEMYFGIYQQFISYEGDESSESSKGIHHYKHLSPSFFDLIIIDECHRGSARDDSEWRAILEYFSGAVQIGMTATPKDSEDGANTEYFGKPLYIYSLKQGIEDGFLAPYMLLEDKLSLDIGGYKVKEGEVDVNENPLEEGFYKREEFDRNIFIKSRTVAVARAITDFLRNRLGDPCAKTIVFCETEEAADLLRQELITCNSDKVKENPNYIVRITSGDEAGKAELENFTSTKNRFPVIVTTSQLLSTGVDTKMVKLIVLNKLINSPIEFRQIIGRGTRLLFDEGKKYFTILDFTGRAKEHFGSDFDADVIEVAESRHKFPPQNPEPSEIKKSKKIHVKGEECYVLHELEYIFDKDGKPMPIDFKAFSRTNLTSRFGSIEELKAAWERAKNKSELITEFEESGILIEELRDRPEFRELDEFDIMVQLAFGLTPMTRKDRAKKAGKVLAQYEGIARQILENVLEKYEAVGITELESPEITKTEPFSSEFGGLDGIKEAFGSIEKYKQAITLLKTELYSAA